jgi:hypothetical protein
MSSLVLEDEALGYEVDSRHRVLALSERCGVATSRQLTGQERRSQQARYSRRPTPTRMSGSHRRHNKHTGL